MVQLYQDAMAIVRKFGRPDLFVTFTINPKWPDIQVELMAGQTAQDRPDLVSRVFQLKLSALHEEIKNGLFGSLAAQLWVIEFQKRGLPHAHILVILNASSKMSTPEEYDSIVSAELPDEGRHPEAYETVIKCMVHGPCGVENRNAPCMKDGKCTKHYPRAFMQETLCDEGGYPVYRRRNDGRSVIVRGRSVDNRWIVPHNLYLATKYNAHINVEVCLNLPLIS